MNNKRKRSIIITASFVLVALFGTITIIALTNSNKNTDHAADQRTTVQESSTATNEANSSGTTDRVSRESLSSSIEKSMENDPSLRFSSNPYDFIKDGKNEYFNELIARGPDVLPDLEDALYGSEENGLEEFLLALAIEEVSQVDVTAIESDPFAYSNTIEFRKMWSTIRQETPERVIAIVNSKEMNDDEKMEQLGAYGILAVPTLEKMVLAGELDNKLLERVEDRIESFDLSTNTKRALAEDIPKF